MLRSLYSAVSGVKAHQTYLDVTGNNIANVNTVGFKRDMTLFADQIYQTQKSASAPNNDVPIGGINPAQVGLGVQVAAIETIHTQGSAQNTGQETDMMINGNGFFVTEMGGQRYYTRSGAFSLDKNYNLVQSGTGYLVQGYNYHDQLNPATGRTERVRDTELSTVRIPIGEKIPAKATELVNFRCNLCQTVTGEITDYEAVPGGTETVLRPHDYVAYGAASYVAKLDAAPTDAPTGGVTRAIVLNAAGDGGTIYTFSAKDGAWDAGVPMEPYNIYYYLDGNNDAGSRSFTTGNGAITGTVADYRVTVDAAGTTADFETAETDIKDPAKRPAWAKAGATFLNTETGEIRTVNAKGNGFEPQGTTLNVAQANVAYAVRDRYDDTAGTTNGLVYMRKATTDPGTGAPVAMEEVAGYIADADKSYNPYIWDGSRNLWVNENHMNGLSPTVESGKESTTTQATIDAFGKSMVANNDHTIKLTVYDSLGNPRTMEIFFRKVLTKPSYPNGDPTSGNTTPTAAETEWDWYAAFLNADGSLAEQYGEGAGTLVFGDDGLLKRTYYFEATPASPDPSATATTGPVYNWTIQEFDVARDAGTGKPTGKMIADFGVSGAEGHVDGSTIPVSYESNQITLDFLGYDYSQLAGLDYSGPIDGVTDFASATTTVARYQDGYAMGVLNNFSVGGDGIVTGQYSNGQSLPVAMVALATFANDKGLTKVGGTYFQESANSGMAQIGAPGTNSSGTILSNNLEMSNVDLSEEFVNLIRAQRGLQANSRVVTTSDQVLEELINLKR